MKGRATRRSEEQVPVRELKDHLSEYLRAVENGAVVVVTSHGRPLADLVPHASDAPPMDRLTIREPTRPWGSVELPRTARGRTDSVALLLEDRHAR